MILILIVYNCRIVAIIKRHKIAVFFYTYVRVLHRLTIGTVDQQIWFVRHVFVLPGSFTLFTEKTSLCQATRRQGGKASLFIAFCVRTSYVFLEDIDWTGWLCLRFIGWIMMVLLGDFFFIAGNWTPVSLFRLESPRFGHGTYDAFCTFQAELPLDDCFTRVLAHNFCSTDLGWSGNVTAMGSYVSTR